MKTRYFPVFMVDGEITAVQITQRLEWSVVDLKVIMDFSQVYTDNFYVTIFM